MRIKPQPFRYRMRRIAKRAEAVSVSLIGAEAASTCRSLAVEKAYELGYRDAVAHLRAEIKYQDDRSMRLHNDVAASTTIACLARDFTGPVR